MLCYAVNRLELVRPLKSCISIGKFPTGKQDYLFRRPAAPGNFPVERTKESSSIYKPTGIHSTSIDFFVGWSYGFVQDHK